MYETSQLRKQMWQSQIQDQAEKEQMSKWKGFICLLETDAYDYNQ